MTERRTDLPHVTDILGKAGLVDDRWFTKEACDRGQAVHLATQLVDEGDLDRSTVADNVAGRLAAYELFLSEQDVEIFGTEIALEHPTLRYCGTCDRALRINRKHGILDLKPPSKERWHGVQLAAYLEAAMVNPPAVAGFEMDHSGLYRWSLHLKDNGRYNLVPHTDPRDLRVFKAAMTIAEYKERA